MLPLWPTWYLSASNLATFLRHFGIHLYLLGNICQKWAKLQLNQMDETPNNFPSYWMNLNIQNIIFEKWNSSEQHWKWPSFLLDIELRHSNGNTALQLDFNKSQVSVFLNKSKSGCWCDESKWVFVLEGKISCLTKKI